MKLHVVSPDAGGCIDGTITRQILKHLPLTNDRSQADAIVVPIAWHPNYRFAWERLDGEYGRPIILLDFLEFGWDAADKENRLGFDALDTFSHLNNGEWQKLSQWVCMMTVTGTKFLTFKRELFERDRTETMLPIEWLCDHPIPPIQTKEQFDARPIEIFHCWGYSNPARVKLHADIFMAMTNRGIEVMDRLEHPRDRGTRLWASIYSPWYARAPLAHVLAVQQQAKISVSMPGAGVKCFRGGEAPVGAIMALPYDNLAWSYPWNDSLNCIRFVPDCAFDTLHLVTNEFSAELLHSIYVEGQRNLDNYRCEKYCRDYILPNIERVL